jgi:hypothetical protein
MPIISSRITVTDAATQVVDPTRGGVPDPISAVIKNAGATTCYLGGIGVTAAAGYELAPGEPFNADLVAGDVLYAITAAGSTTLHVMRFRQ